MEWPSLCRSSIAFALLTVATAAKADQSVCSIPARAGVKAVVDVPLQAGGAIELEDRLAAAAKAKLNMSAGLVTGEDPYKQPVLLTRNLILQSPEVSVAIHVRTSNRNSLARITLERTCITDALEPWQPYWKGMQAILRQHGYRYKLRLPTSRKRP